MKKYIVLLLLSATVFLSCSEEKIKPYEGPNYVGFAEGIKDTTLFSFFFYLNDVVDYTIDVNLTGKLLEHDTKFDIRINDKSTIDRTLVEVPESFVFHAGVPSDKIVIRLKNAPILASQQFILKLDIVDNEDLKSVGGDFGSRILNISDKVERPKWWTENPIEWYFLGEYSRLKYEKFMIATGVSDLTGMDSGEIRILSLKFKRWLEENGPIWDEENGVNMNVVVIG